jgi:hypothetical protein
MDGTSDEEWVDDDNDDEITDNFVEGVNTEETILDNIQQKIADVIDKIREIVNKIKSSSILTAFIEKKRLIFNSRVKQRKKIKRHLAIDVRTRWNSTYKMLCTVNMYRDIINDLFKSKGSFGFTAKQRLNFTRIELSTDQWDLLKLLIGLLQPFYSATKVLSNTKYPTVGSALYIIKGLEEYLERKDGDLMLNALKLKMLIKFQYYTTDDVEQFNTLKVSDNLFQSICF